MLQFVFCSCHDGYCQFQCGLQFVGGDAEHYTTVGENAAFLLLLVHVLIHPTVGVALSPPKSPWTIEFLA